ncbi:MAG: hypothetical protein IJY54_06275 [Paludibacteraceae bacterium]|nr:hypothetical protein [Paludibacteraceae bacterium]
MSNGIAARQNEERAIAMLAAQRQLYNDAKMFDAISVALSVWLPLVMALILLFLPEESNWKSVSYVLAIVSMMFSFVIDKHIDNKKKLAAFIQQKFDVFVYDMPWNERIFGKDKNVNGDIVAYSKQILGNADEKARLCNWYTPTVDDRDLFTGILLCQRENLRWDVGLRKRYRLISVIMILLLCLIVFVMGLWKNESVSMLLCRFAFVAPMLEWLLGTVRTLNKDIERIKELDEVANGEEAKAMEELQDIQRMIFEHRKECYAIPNCIYQMFKDNDEDMARRVVLIENED